ncbi:CAF17-like 4Fe-4S cluster assembly/insertion protein YgfZ [Litoreibacter arenae]|uniref:Folate-dependent protein for Fe/S cluster synthesis/repair in oxidative stress n=1 Tax=Litoreibacter arenae DSM 19593 TaxID=1123360 RepID=S9RS28_9RHOB|nr:folate-binding protein YgfZ [Litoreibacter arenae]EPX80870.1 Folate-dependent protein for Fe/S cluster synthesis/repair in oxidative stress [Litoreibacter arenae DSM 19593]
MPQNERMLIEVTGSERVDFLQGLVTNDLAKLSDGLVYAALLTPQGKFQVDFFLVPWKDAILIDVAAPYGEALMRRLTFYKLRADVKLHELQADVSRGVGDIPSGAFADPRHEALGWRAYGPGFAFEAQGDVDWDAIRVAHCIPELGIELIPDDSFILEMGFERLNGVDFRKGCYVGQEVTARMKHKTELRKGLALVDVKGEAPVGTPIDVNNKAVGTLYTQSGGRAMAYLRFDRATEGMTAGDARVDYLRE